MVTATAFEGTLNEAIHTLTGGAPWYTQDDMVRKNLNRPVTKLLRGNGIELAGELVPLQITKVSKETARKRGGDFKVTW